MARGKVEAEAPLPPTVVQKSVSERLSPPHKTGKYDEIYPTGRADPMYRRAGKLHREDGPAVVWADGTQLYYFEGKLHREDGPAVIHVSGVVSHFVNGVEVKTTHFDEDGQTVES